MIPEELLYSREHEWLRIDDDGIATVGITDHAQEELGDIVYVELPEDGDELEADEVMGTVESVKAVSEVYSPVAGTVAGVNATLEAAPERMNEDPYGNGWLVRLKLEDPAAPAATLLSAAGYAAYLAEEEDED